MINELLLIISIPLMFGGLLLAFKLFGRAGVAVWIAIATITANIEVMIVVRAFGLEMTLGNILFASTFLATDIMSERYGKEAAQRSVWIGIFASLTYLVISQTWLMYRPTESDWAMPHFRGLFTNTPRLIIASFLVYMAVQMLDVKLYHRIWNFTERRFGDRSSYLWLRNNGATIVSQFLNALLFNIFAFYGVYGAKTLTMIVISTFAIYVITAICDTPFIYIARRLKPLPDGREENDGRTGGKRK